MFADRSAKEALPFAESLRQAIASSGFVLRGPDRPQDKPEQKVEPKSKKSVTIAISIGLAERSKSHSTPELVLEAADHALYRAKEAGRNCTKLAEGTAG